MSKRCARCEKVVYPIEELKCLDKTWHKGCFKCQKCGMTLSMKTYKGFNKFPYCEAHIPKVKATTVAETPETKRLAENTKIQSNVQYHAEFEKNKARFTQVADDPETMRLKQNTKNISNVTYHGELEKKAKMESQRDQEGDPEFVEKVPMEKPAEPQIAQAPQQLPPQMAQKQPSSHYTSVPSTGKQQQQYNRVQRTQSNQYYQGLPGAYAVNYHSQPQHHQQAIPSHQSHVQHHQQSMHHTSPQNHQPPPQQYHQPYINPITQTYTYQDSNRNAPAQYGARQPTLIYTSQTGPVHEASESVGSISDYDPLNNQYGSISAPGRHQSAPTYRQDSNKGQRGHYHGEGQQMSAHSQHLSNQKINAPPTNLGRCYRAIYDYEAADADEVSFKDGDLIMNCTGIDGGWMTGTVQRSGRVGMLPANYVRRVS